MVSDRRALRKNRRNIMKYLILLILLVSCGKKESNKSTYNVYEHCSKAAYANSCSQLVVKRLLQPYELWDYYCHQDYLQCLGRH